MILEATNGQCTDVMGLRHEQIERFFSACPDAALSQKATKIVRRLAACADESIGNPAGWAAGIIYFLANRDRIPCGVPGVLNAEFAGFFDVSMGKIRRRAALVRRWLNI